MPLSPELEAVVNALAAKRPAEVTLDEIAEALGTRAAGYSEVDTIIAALEAAGVRVKSPDASDLPRELAQVLGAARKLGGVPTVDAIAAATHLDPAAVRRALLYARVLSR